MTHTRKFAPALALLSLGALALAPMSAHAQTSLPPISIDLRDAPIRSALEQIFNSANLQYSIDPQVSGFVTLKIRDQPFENALKLIMRTATVPLTYTKENEVYIVKPRPATVVSSAPEIAPEVEEIQRRPADIIPLTYIDAMDLQQLIGPFHFVRPFSRAQQGGGGLGGFGGGQGGFGGLGGLGAGGLGGGGFGGLGGSGLGGFGGGGLGGFGGGQGGFGNGGLGGGLGGGNLGGGLGGFGGGSGGIGGGNLGGGRAF